MLQTIVFSQIANALGVRRFTRVEHGPIFFDPISDRWGNVIGQIDLPRPFSGTSCLQTKIE
jgi:hypothetical protein